MEINWGNNLYKVPTKVVVVLKDAILVNPVVCQGIVLDLDKFRDMCYNIISKDKKDGHVITWKNVLIQKTKYKNITLYQIESPKYAQLAQHNERRENGRTLVDKVGSVYVGSRENRKTAVIHDISSNGISFYVAGGFESDGKTISVEFDDMINDRMFHLRLDCTFVREVEQNDHFLVGCSVKNVERNILEYVCLKRMSDSRRDGKDKTEE